MKKKSKKKQQEEASKQPEPQFPGPQMAVILIFFLLFLPSLWKAALATRQRHQSLEAALLNLSRPNRINERTYKHTHTHSYIYTYI